MMGMETAITKQAAAVARKPYPSDVGDEE